jgi:hypothetical protein
MNCKTLDQKKKVTTDEVAINSLTREKFLDYGFSSKAYPKYKHLLHHTNDIFKGKKLVKKLKYTCNSVINKQDMCM